jgi:GWxTD domain-containing protein
MLINALVAAATLATHMGGQSGAGGLEMRAVRFWLPEVQRTSVLAMVEVPYAIATPIGTGPTAYIAYQVLVQVNNDKGQQVNAEKWTRHAPAALRTENASGMEELAFGVVPGNYWLKVAVTDSGTSKITTDSIRISGYADSPGASDLLLANNLRAVPAGDTATELGEVARGQYRMVTAPLLHVDITKPNLGFLFEAYSHDSTTASLTLKISTSAGAPVVSLPPVPKTIPAGGGVIANEFSLDGLPQGEYLLTAALTMNGKTVDREAPFTVNQAEQALARNIAENNANRGLDEVYFNSLPEDSLDAEAEELQLIPDASSRERALYKKDDLSLTAKRRFLIEFWAKRDRNKNTPENEDRIAFYSAVGYANTHYGARYKPGWKTARGAIYAKYGAPDDSMTMDLGGRSKVRWLVWRINRGKPRWFILGDRDNNGDYQVLRSNEPTISGTPGWRELMDPEAVHNIALWLGLNKEYFDYDN